MELLKTLPDTRERTQQELTLQIALGPPYWPPESFASPEVGATYNRTRELCQQVGETATSSRRCLDCGGFIMCGASLHKARELGEQLLRLAQSSHDPALLLEAHRALGVTLFGLGEFSTAQGTWSKGLRSTIPSNTARMPSATAIEPGVFGLCCCRLGPVASGLCGPGTEEDEDAVHWPMS